MNNSNNDVQLGLELQAKSYALSVEKILADKGTGILFRLCKSYLAALRVRGILSDENEKLREELAKVTFQRDYLLAVMKEEI